MSLTDESLELASGKELSLREQSVRVDQLTNENTNLKFQVHFLQQKIQQCSPEGVEETSKQITELQKDLTNERKEKHDMRRKIKELQVKNEELQDALTDARHSGDTRSEDDDDPTLQAEMHAEILSLRQQLDISENRVTTLREEVMTKETEKRKMAENIRKMADKRGADTAGVKETMDMWQDLLNAETGRREQAEEDASRLREELNNLRLEHATPSNQRHNENGRIHSPLDSSDAFMQNAEDEEYKALIDQLKHENAELRRDLGAQTSMLTSRNRERERLQQEIEDMRLLHRKFDGAQSVAGESIFDRSISRAHRRSQSRASDHTQVTEAERDAWDKKEGDLRDANAELRIKHQELERTHNTYLSYVQALEEDFKEMEKELDEARDDLVTIQKERDDAIKAMQNIDGEYTSLKQEALDEIASLEAELQAAVHNEEQTAKKLQTASSDYNGLQNELRQITQSIMNLEETRQHNMRTIERLEQQLSSAEDEMQKLEQKCNDFDEKNRILENTEETHRKDISFLRDEQERDKLKIGELEEAVNTARQQIQDEQEKLRELETSIVDERRQRDVLENKSKEEVQKILDDLNSEVAKTKDEVRKLRRALSSKEIEATSIKQKHDELEQDLRHLLGNKSGTKPSLLADIEKIQRELETTASALDRAKMDLSDKERLLRHRDGLLESSSLESRRLSDLLDKERASRKHELNQFEKASRGQASHIRTIAEKESQVLELETAFAQAQRKTASLESQYQEHIHERNNILLALWMRLSTLCGSDWAQAHALLDGEQPSNEAISRHLGSFNKNIFLAVRTVEGLIGSFKVRIRSIEKDLWRDYQTLEQNVEMRIRKMDSLETAVADTQYAMATQQQNQRVETSRSGSVRLTKGSEEIAKLKSEVKLLKAELKFHRQHPSALAQQMINQQAQMNPESAARRQSTSTSPARHIVNSLFRHQSTSAVEQLHRGQQEAAAASENSRPQSIILSGSTEQPNDSKWVHRLKELERRLKAEREGRLLDRKGARQRLEEAGVQNEELRRMLEKHDALARESEMGSSS